MGYRIELDASAERDLAKLGSESARRILRFLNERLAVLDNPRAIGEALKGSKLGDLWRYRVGDHRVIADIEDRTLRILVIKIGNRRDVYHR